MDPETELNLIRKSIDGDHQAFRQLVESHQGLAYSLAYRFTREEKESEDIVQEAFVKLWKNLSRYNAQYRLKTWLCKIVTNLSLDYLKSGRKKKVMSENNFPAKSMIERVVHEDELESEELKSIVLRLAEQLTEKQKVVFILRDLETLSSEEVCQTLEMTPGNMKSNLYHARLKIKDGLQKIYKTKLI
ncbi:MAG: RNA polymerase sigma factor [Bacteroidetes bacterium]|nr:RNA polymerase sigma factor [Bacteroidota bacterium]MBI3483477.1 RNA polymerase sigma factor [Bacteroidota bacterium]